ncbi:hypothetical protein JJD73_06950 [Pseudomonas fluorescens]|nr:hypothetical protein [Pseudomonas fluorescens]
MRNEVVKKEPANINTTTVQPTPTATVYGMPAYADRAAAVGEVHARPHLLLQVLPLTEN